MYFFNRLAQVTGFVEGLRFKGISDINIDNLYYNIILGRLDVNLVIPNLWLEIGELLFLKYISTCDFKVYGFTIKNYYDGRCVMEILIRITAAWNIFSLNY